VAAVPWPRGSIAIRWFFPCIALGCIAAMLFAGWIKINSPTVVQFQSQLPSIPDQVHWMLAHPLRMAVLITRSLVAFLLQLWTRLYTFGDSTIVRVPAAAIAGAAALVLVVIRGEPRISLLPWSRRLWMLVIFGAVALLIAIALFITDTSPSEATIGFRGGKIGGIQGRYFLPTLPLVLIATLPAGRSRSFPMMCAALLCVVIAHVATLETIARTFYSL